MSGMPAQPRVWRKRLRWCAFAGMVLTLAPVLLFHAAVYLWPYPAGLDAARPGGTWIEDRSGVPLAAFVADDQQWHLPLAASHISPHLLNAVIAIEDARFREHAGVDWRSAGAAAWQNARAMRIRRGASTITMQLHRLRDPRPRSFVAKLEQAIRAEQIERSLSKEQILTEYVNRAPFGGNLVGAGAASWRYFGRPCGEVSLAQAALLAGLPKNPNRYRPDRHPEQARTRRDMVLSRMFVLGMITAEQRDLALAEPVDAGWRPLPQMRPDAALMADGAMPSLIRLHLRYPGQAMRTTTDGAVQRQACQAALSHLDVLRNSGVSALALAVLDTQSAEVLASVSISPSTKALDLTRTPRSTGSVLKPFIYAAAFDMGIARPQSILHDTPVAWPGYTPANYDRSFRGAMHAADALAESRNIPALVLLSQVTVDRAASLMGLAGLRSVARSPDRYGLSLAIGGAEASVIEVAEAYATLGRGGAPRGTSVRLPVPSPAGSTQPIPPVGAPAAQQPILRAESCSQTLAALAEPARTRAHCPEAAASHVAWKTGTSSGHRDAWCAAVTRSRTVVVWVGNPDSRASACLVGQEAAAPLALRLAASLSGEQEPWPAPPADTAPAGVVRLAMSRRITLLSPTDGLEVVANRDLRPEQQQLLLRALPAASAASADLPSLFWFVNGQPLGVTRGDDRLFWPPTPGKHEIRVVDAEGHAATARITVR